MKIFVGAVTLVFFAAVVFHVSAQTTEGEGNDNSGNDNANKTEVGRDIYLGNVFGLDRAFAILGNQILRELRVMGEQCGCSGLPNIPNLPSFPLNPGPPQGRPTQAGPGQPAAPPA